MIPIPTDVRAAILRRADGRCEDCGGELPLELHHLRYRVEAFDPKHDRDDSIHGKETINDLAALCRDCHHNRHLDPNGEYWRDPEEMADHWWGYFNELEVG